MQAAVHPTTSKFAPGMNPFLKSFWKAPAPAASARCVPDGMRVYCVGDIHGRDDLLRQMADRVEADLDASSFDQAVTVFLGDYVRSNRIDMDSAACATGRLTCLVLEKDQRRFLHVGGCHDG